MDFSSPEMMQRLRETADALQVTPLELLTQISYETAGTLDPRQPGPTTKWGQHRGYIQFGEPQAADYGVDFSSPEAAATSQLGADGAIVRYAKAHGFIPGEHSAIDLYSSINAGGPGRYGASDEAAGGAPGTVADKFYEQMHGHRAKAESILGGEGGSGLGVGPTRARAKAGVGLAMPKPGPHYGMGIDAPSPEPEEPQDTAFSALFGKLDDARRGRQQGLDASSKGKFLGKGDDGSMNVFGRVLNKDQSNQFGKGLALAARQIGGL